MQNRIRIDLISDTATRPTPGMRQAMAEAEVGDEQLGEDPTVNSLCERVADLLGQEAALFLPSGTMCNQVAIATHCRAGDEIIAAQNAHIIGSEGAGAAVFASAFIRAIPTLTGIFSAEDLRAAIRTAAVKSPKTRLVSLEQSTNQGGGSVWPAETIREVSAAARQNELVTHMDGARIMNAVVASGEEAARYTCELDSVWLDLSKGLGCPIGAVLAGSHAFVEAANIWKHRFGGAMRQAGIVAAAGLYALDHHIDRLADDHANARRFAAGLENIPGVELNQGAVATNLVFFDVAATGQLAADVARQLLADGIRIGVQGETRMRAVTHLDVDADGIDTAVAALERILTGE